MPSITILNACASPAARGARADLLCEAGFAVADAASAVEARALLESRVPDVLLLGDLGPSDDLRALCRTIKSEPATAAVSIVRIAPAGTQPAEQAACLESGSDLVLVEPVDGLVLLAQLRALARAITDGQSGRRFLRTVIDSVAGIVAVRDANGCFLLVNEAAARFHGRTVRELEGANAKDLPSMPPEWLEEDRYVLTTGTDTRSEFEAADAEGRAHALVVYRTPLRNGDGVLDRLLITGVDITWRRLAEAALRESEERFSSLFNKAPFALALGRRPSGVLADINEACEEMLGLRRDEAIGKTTLDLGIVVAPEERARIYEEVRQHGAAHGIESRYRTRSGDLRVIAHHVKPVIIDGQEYLIDAMQDVTERNRAEMALRESEQRLRSHVENSPLAVVEWDNDFVVTRWAGGAERMFGFAAAETVGRPLMDLHLVFEEDIPIVERVMGRLTDGATRQVVSSNRNYTRDGRLIHCTWYNSVLLDGEGRMASVLSLVLDVTERARAEAGLRDANARLAEANARLAEADRRKDEFIAVLSHELRNPLAPIRYAVPILDRYTSTEDGRRALAVIERQAGYLTRLVDDLLDVSRITRGQVELRPQGVTLASIVTSAVEAASPAIEAARHNLKVNLPGEEVWLNADPARLSQIVTNLLNNAAKYTPRGGEIVVEAGCGEGSEAFVRVRDNGVGIPPEAMPDIFDMFRRVDRPDKAQGGLGIGLGLVKQLIELHGGSVEVRSGGPGRGAEFTVRLPAAAAPEAGARIRRGEGGGVADAARTLKVLVVDDNADLVEMLGLVVETAGHDVRKALDGATALAAALAYRPDVVLLDLGLPGMSGIDVAREMKRKPGFDGMRIVALTGWGQPEDRERTRAAGFDEHLTKPTDPDRLTALLAEYAAERR